MSGVMTWLQQRSHRLTTVGHQKKGAMSKEVQNDKEVKLDCTIEDFRRCE